MYLELEERLAVIDLRTKEGVLDYIRKYDVDIISCGKEIYYTEDLYVFKEETGTSDEQVVDILFDKKHNEYEVLIEQKYSTCHGDVKAFEPIVGEISYFAYEECDYDPGYRKISEEEFYNRIKPMKEFLTKLENVTHYKEEI